MAALVAAFVLSLAPEGTAHHCKGPSCATLKDRYRACARFSDHRRHMRCEIVRAARHYHQDAPSAIRVATCESGLRWWIGGHHQGAWQFLWSTWASLPYAARSPFSAKWSSLAAMHAWSVGRRGEWSCA